MTKVPRLIVILFPGLCVLTVPHLSIYGCLAWFGTPKSFLFCTFYSFLSFFKNQNKTIRGELPTFQFCLLQQNVREILLKFLPLFLISQLQYNFDTAATLQSIRYIFQDTFPPGYDPRTFESDFCYPPTPPR